MSRALLIIDLQVGLLEEEPRAVESDGVIGRINAMAERARARGAPVIFCQHEETGTPWAFATAGWQLDARLVRQMGDLHVRKTALDAFLGTTLQDQLVARGVDHLVVAGYASEFCVDTTVRRAAGLGYAVTLVSDAHTTQDKPHLSADHIRRHHNLTLVEATNFPGKISLAPAATLWA